jgi:membrane protease subunit HflC
MKGARSGLLIGVVIAAAVLLANALFTVDEREQVIVTQFGDPVREPITEAGLHFRIPFIQKVNMVERRILEWDGLAHDMPTRDKLYISVDTFGRWRIQDPLQFFLRLRDERSAQSRLEDILGSETRNAVAKHELIEIIRTTRDRVPLQDETLAEADVKVGQLLPIRKGRHRIEEEIFRAASAKLADFGIELLDVRFKRINYNQDVRVKIYERMISERQQIAERFRSEGAGEAARILGNRERDLRKIESEAYKLIQKIRGDADAEATLIYAEAYNQSPESVALYEFIKSMEAYRTILDDRSTLILTTESDLFQFLKDMDGGSTP